MSKKQLYFESLGCARNTVDSEIMKARLKDAGWSLLNDPADADTIIVNTCSFIEPAINESIDTILALAQQKKSGACRRLIVAGCLPERFREAILHALPEVDAFIGTGAFDQVTDAADGRLNGTRCILPDPDAAGPSIHFPGRVRTDPHSAYLKIAEGCSRGCTYCIIPKLRGKQKSRPVEAILTEARGLIRAGVKELVLVAQDTTAYGTDLPSPVPIGTLLKRMAGISDSVWIRILYGHPESITDDFLTTVAMLPTVCSYFDIPIQHAADRILRRMGRNYTRTDLYRIFDRIRHLMPEAALRTTLITGFPGETDGDVQEAIEFMERVRFDHLGVFIYSDAEDLASHPLADKVAPKVARRRRDLLMSRQRDISRENNRKHLHRCYDVLIEELPEAEPAAGRTWFQAPEVDGSTLVSSQGPLQTGRLIQVEITDTLEYDLIGKPVCTS